MHMSVPSACPSDPISGGCEPLARVYIQLSHSDSFAAIWHPVSSCETVEMLPVGINRIKTIFKKERKTWLILFEHSECVLANKTWEKPHDRGKGPEETSFLWLCFDSFSAWVWLCRTMPIGRTGWFAGVIPVLPPSGSGDSLKVVRLDGKWL